MHNTLNINIPFMKKMLFLIFIIQLISCSEKEKRINFTISDYDMHFTELSKSWDEAIPLGNGMLGALVWQKDDKLRLSLDRADLWDLRPMENLKTPEWKYSWVKEQWEKDTYKEVQNRFDLPYDKSPAPSKIPAAAIEFDIASLGKVISVRLHHKEAICEVRWENGAILQTFVHATNPIGWYKFEGTDKEIKIKIIPPAYNLEGESGADNPVNGQDLRRLGYPKGKVINKEGNWTYDQEGWGGFSYQVHVKNKQIPNGCLGSWSISSQLSGDIKENRTAVTVLNETKEGWQEALKTHRIWWKEFWSRSDITIPDQIIQKQWYLEQYKFGAAARKGAPPISLQAVWTADNGKLPPWKGDFHHDLNTQLSYWPSYSGNHLDGEEAFIDWLWKYKKTFKEYTKSYYEHEGLNVPGVTTLTGDPMGGWIQYSFGPTVSAWLGHHFYLHWRYSMDTVFLKERAYPWIKEVAIFLDQLSVKGTDGLRKLPISSSPEIYNNSRKAWFSQTTNFDLALIKWTYEKAAELAHELGLNEEAKKWDAILIEWPELAVDPKSGLMFSPKVTYHESHRHFSHLVGFHPLGIVDVSNGTRDKELIERTISNLEEIGSKAWVGYSFSWLANLQARAFDGEGAAETLRIFAENFCLPNTFHVNGEQYDRGYSNFKYRPFTLEGNFAFAAGVQEMLIQSHTGIVHIFPAIPKSWSTVSFDQLRAEGAFLISATKENGSVKNVEIVSEKGGVLKFKNPFGDKNFIIDTAYKLEKDILIIPTNSGQRISLEIQ